MRRTTSTPPGTFRRARAASAIRICALLLAGSGLTNAGTLAYSITDLGSNVYRYDYYLYDFHFQANQELDIRFDPAVYKELSNGTAGSGFHLELLQPDNPPGTFGDYSALALVNNPSLFGPFQVDVVYVGPGTPGLQPFLVNEYDATGLYIGTLEQGATLDIRDTPEPGNWSLAAGGLLAGALWRIVLSRRPKR